MADLDARGAGTWDGREFADAKTRSAEALGAAEALQAARLGALRLTGLIDPFDSFGDAVTTRMPAHRIVLASTSEAYLAALWAGSGNRLKNYRRYRRSLEKAAGPLRVVGDDRDAEHLCERLLSYSSTLGLYGEELEASSGRHLGNYPQAFTHLALVGAAVNIDGVHYCVPRQVTCGARAGCRRRQPGRRARGHAPRPR